VSTLDCITERTLRTLAGERWFARGEAYHKEARLTDLEIHHDSISARVRGTDTYRVRLSCRNNRLTYNCTCPVGEDGNFCKHCVAVGLAWLSQPADEQSQSKSSLQTFLENMDQQQLVDLIVAEASSNRRLRDKLEFAEATSAPTGPDLSVFKKAITNATRTSGIDYYSMPRFARRLLEAIHSLRSLLEGGHARAVVELTEYTFARLEKAMGQVDDSAGHFGEIIPELTNLHHTACILAREDPIALARRLFEFEVNSDWDLFHGAAAVYADVLGEKGQSEYRRLAKEIWSKIPYLKPGDEAHERYGKRFRITSIMETLARQSGDLEELIAITQRDLSHPYAFLQIAEAYREAGQHDLALHWAEQGAASFERLDTRLSDFMAAEYHRRGFHDRAMMLIWEQFVERPGLEMYKHLHDHALQVKLPRENLRLVGKNDRANQQHNGRGESRPESNDEWERWRREALRFLRERIEPSHVKLRDEGIPISNPWHSHGDRSALVEVFLWECNYEHAWDEAIAGGCSAYLWLQLADRLAEAHPARAYLVYKELIGPTVDGTNNAAYTEATRLLKKMHKLTSRLNCESDFSDYLAALRVEYKRKRNFIQMLDKISVHEIRK